MLASVANFGILARQRTVILPALLVLFSIPPDAPSRSPSCPWREGVEIEVGAREMASVRPLHDPRAPRPACAAGQRLPRGCDRLVARCRSRLWILLAGIAAAGSRGRPDRTPVVAAVRLRRRTLRRAPWDGRCPIVAIVAGRGRPSARGLVVRPDEGTRSRAARLSERERRVLRPSLRRRDSSSWCYAPRGGEPSRRRGGRSSRPAVITESTAAAALAARRAGHRVARILGSWRRGWGSRLVAGWRASSSASWEPSSSGLLCPPARDGATGFVAESLNGDEIRAVARCVGAHGERIRPSGSASGQVRRSEPGRGRGPRPRHDAPGVLSSWPRSRASSRVRSSPPFVWAVTRAGLAVTAPSASSPRRASPSWVSTPASTTSCISRSSQYVSAVLAGAASSHGMKNGSTVKEADDVKPPTTIEDGSDA